MAPSSVRPATDEDHDEILELMVAVIRASISSRYHDETVKNVRQNLAIWRKGPDECVHLVAHGPEGSLTGVVLVKEFWNLSSLFVLPSHQGQGIGRNLVLAAIERCRGRSPIRALNLNSAPDAVSFYKRLGFTERQTTRPLPPGFIAMRLPLGEA